MDGVNGYTPQSVFIKENISFRFYVPTFVTT